MDTYNEHNPDNPINQKDVDYDYELPTLKECIENNDVENGLTQIDWIVFDLKALINICDEIGKAEISAYIKK
jgi:hypothetical protein